MSGPDRRVARTLASAAGINLLLMTTKPCFPLPSAIVPASLVCTSEIATISPKRSGGGARTEALAAQPSASEEQARANPQLVEETWPIERQLLGDFRPSPV